MLASFAAEIGLSEEQCGQVSIIVTELAGNLVKHTPAGGQLVYRELDQSHEALGLEILCLDQGPGMYNVTECLRDGFSTAGSPGTGLGAVSRLSSTFDIYSMPRLGTAIVSRLSFVPKKNYVRKRIEYGAVSFPVGGETLCGDGWALESNERFESFLIADGLGHGPEASKAAEMAIHTFEKNVQLGANDLVQAAHLALRSTRGAAVAVARIDHDKSHLSYSGVGNTVGVILSRDGKQRRMVSHNGTAGVQVRKFQEFTYPWTPTSTLVLHSDGLTTHWNLEKYPELLNHHPSLIAGVLYRDFKRGNDDVSVLIARQATV